MTGGSYGAALMRQRLRTLRERGTPINPERITIALDLSGQYGPDVDIACGGIEPMVDEWEAGVRTPTTEQLQALARLTGFTEEWFYLAPMPPLENVFFCDVRRRMADA